MSLDALFNKILETEQNAELRRIELVQVEKDIKSKEVDISCLKRRSKELEEIIRQKDLPALYESKWELELTTARLESLQREKTKLQKRIEELQEQVDERTQERHQELDGFLTKIATFTEKHDLMNGKEKRNRQMLENLAVLKTMESKLKEELKSVESHRNIARETANEAARLRSEVSEMQCRIIDLDSELEEKRRENERKKADLASSTNAHLNDPEYRRLEAELQSLDGDVEQKAIAALRNELENLQRRKWMKESSKKRVKLVDNDANFNSRRYSSSFK